MSHLVNNVIKPLVLVAVAAILSAGDQGCQSVPPAASPEADYIQETSQCVDNAKTLQESHQCRAKVNWKYGLCPDPTGSLLCQ